MPDLTRSGFWKETIEKAVIEEWYMVQDNQVHSQLHVDAMKTFSLLETSKKAFPKFMGFMKSDEGIAERRKIADLSKTIGTVTPDQAKSCSKSQFTTWMHCMHFEWLESCVEACF